MIFISIWVNETEIGRAPSKDMIELPTRRKKL
jgi:hypothetical protein